MTPLLKFLICFIYIFLTIIAYFLFLPMFPVYLYPADITTVKTYVLFHKRFIRASKDHACVSLYGVWNISVICKVIMHVFRFFEL